MTTTAATAAPADTATVDLLRRLVEIDSVNPDLVPGGAGEADIAQLTMGWLTDRGFDCQLIENTPGRPSVLAVARGSGAPTGRGPARSVMLNGHLDTVALASYDGGAARGLTPVIRDGNLYGRGAYDMKSGVAAIMVAAASAAAQPHGGDIMVALVADEEYVSVGTEEVLRHLAGGAATVGLPDTAIIVEPSGLDLVVAHKGFVWAEITVHGVAAHGSRPDLGIDAIAQSGRFLTALGDLGARLVAGTGGRRHPMLGSGSVHASTIAGGTEASSYPDRCSIVVERRTVPGEDAAVIEAELRGLLDEVASGDPDFRYDLAIRACRSPFAAREDSAVAAALTDAFRTVTGAEPGRRGEAFWTDCALLDAAGIDTVLFGVDGGGAHAATEWVDLASLDTVTRTLDRAVRLITA